MKISVVILNYNGRDFVGKCVDSVLDSDYKDYEVVVVDNGSSDGSCEYLKERYKKKKKVRVFRMEKNDYFTGGFNFGVKKARGEKILILSNDIVVERECLGQMFKVAEKDKKVLVQPKVLFYDERDIFDNVGGIYKFGVGRLKGRGERDKRQYEKDSGVDFAASAVFMIDRKFFLDLGGYDSWFKYYYEDVDLSLKAKKVGGGARYCHRAVVYHRGGLTVRHDPSLEVSYHVRKNMVWTVINNFTGWELVWRLGVIWFLLLLMMVRDLVSLRFERAGITLKSQVVVFKKLRTDQPWIRSHL